MGKIIETIARARHILNNIWIWISLVAYDGGGRRQELRSSGTQNHACESSGLYCNVLRWGKMLGRSARYFRFLLFAATSSFWSLWFLFSGDNAFSSLILMFRHRKRRASPHHFHSNEVQPFKSNSSCKSLMLSTTILARFPFSIFEIFIPFFFFFFFHFFDFETETETEVIHFATASKSRKTIPETVVAWTTVCRALVVQPWHSLLAYPRSARDYRESLLRALFSCAAPPACR